jgi:hypothetical protein
VHHAADLFLAKVKTVMFEIAKELAAETLPPAPTQEERAAWMRRQGVAARFYENPNHWVDTVSLRIASKPAIVALQVLLLTPGADLTPEQSNTVGNAIYSALLAEMAYFGTRVNV